MLKRTAIDKNFRLRFVAHSLKVSAAIQKEVDRLWNEENSKPGIRLFNGDLLCLSSAGTSVYSIEYKYYLAQLRSPALFADLQLRPIGVSGLLWAQGQIVVGKRDSHLVNSPEKLEFVPSGGLDSKAITSSGEVDFAHHLLRELTEEIGMTSDQIDHLTPVALFECPQTHIVDIALRLDTSLSKKEIEKIFSSQPNPKEYSELFFLSPAEIRQSLAEKPEAWIETSKDLFFYQFPSS